MKSRCTRLGVDETTHAGALAGAVMNAMSPLDRPRDAARSHLARIFVLTGSGQEL